VAQDSHAILPMRSTRSRAFLIRILLACDDTPAKHSGNRSTPALKRVRGNAAFLR